MRVFLDTNVLLDVIIEREDTRFRDDANTILQLGKNGVVELFMSTLSVPTIAYVLKHMSSDSKKNVIGRLTRIVKVLPSLPEHISYILDCPISDIEDALQAQSAKEGQCELIVTRDMTGFKGADIPSLSPDEFLRMVTE